MMQKTPNSTEAREARARELEGLRDLGKRYKYYLDLKKKREYIVISSI
jgi:hypothetical protein